MYVRIRDSEIDNEKPALVQAYGLDFARTLWNEDLFSGRDDGLFLKDVPVNFIKYLSGNTKHKDTLLNIDKHPAMMPYKFVLSSGDLEIKTKEASLL